MRNRLMAIVVAAALVVVAATAVYATDFAVIVHTRQSYEGHGAG